MLEKLLDFHLECGTDAIIVAGTTGESSTLSHEEHIELIKFVVNYINGAIPVIAGTGSNCTKEAMSLTMKAEDAGADAVLMVTPYYNKTSQEGLFQHFHAISTYTQIPIILYNIPSRCSMGIELDTYEKLAKIDNIVAVKEASGNIAYTARLIARYGDRFDVYSGNDDQTVPIMSIGGKGVISVLANCLPVDVHQMTELCLKNDFAKAARIQLQYMKLIHELFTDVNPMPIKEVMDIIGFNCGTCRLPLTRPSVEHVMRLQHICYDLGISCVDGSK